MGRSANGQSQVGVLGDTGRRLSSRGPGSTFRRANAIHGSYDAAAPLPDVVMTTPSAAFLGEIPRIVTSAIIVMVEHLEWSRQSRGYSMAITTQQTHAAEAVQRAAAHDRSAQITM